MKYEFWNDKWQLGEIGFHLDKARSGLVKHFPVLAAGARVLVPLCGKSKDLLWLAEQGYAVTGVEFVEQAAQEFFEENSLRYKQYQDGEFTIYQTEQIELRIVVGDYFHFTESEFNAIYDRAAMVALPPVLREKYVAHSKSLLAPGAKVLLVVLHYPEGVRDRPPFSVSHEQVMAIWGSHMKLIDQVDLRGVDPLFKDADLDFFDELTYLNSD